MSYLRDLGENITESSNGDDDEYTAIEAEVHLAMVIMMGSAAFVGIVCAGVYACKSYFKFGEQIIPDHDVS